MVSDGVWQSAHPIELKSAAPLLAELAAPTEGPQAGGASIRMNMVKLYNVTAALVFCVHVDVSSGVAL